MESQEDFSSYNGEGTDLRKAQLRMLDLMIEVDKICRKNAIPYWLDYGTLLGAVRHDGFIPWDDDLDISVLMKDFSRLKQALITELPQNFAYQDWKTEKRLTMKAAKIRDKYSYFNDGVYDKGEIEYQGMFIDIFPVDKVPPLGFKKVVDFIYGRCFRRLRGLNKNGVDLTIAYVLWPFALVLALMSKALVKIIGSKSIGNIYGGLNLSCTHKLDDIFPLKEISFEGKSFFAPKNVDSHLTRIYNNYMWIPPKEQRLVHACEIIFLEEND